MLHSVLLHDILPTELWQSPKVWSDSLHDWDLQRGALKQSVLQSSAGSLRGAVRPFKICWSMWRFGQRRVWRSVARLEVGWSGLLRNCIQWDLSGKWRHVTYACLSIYLFSLLQFQQEVGLFALSYKVSRAFSYVSHGLALCKKACWKVQNRQSNHATCLPCNILNIVCHRNVALRRVEGLAMFYETVLGPPKILKEKIWCILTDVFKTCKTTHFVWNRGWVIRNIHTNRHSASTLMEWSNGQ